MNISNIEELEEALEELFPDGFTIEIDEHGEVIVHTGLQKDEDGDLSSIESTDDDDDEEEADPDLDPLEDEDVDDEE